MFSNTCFVFMFSSLIRFNRASICTAFLDSFRTDDTDDTDDVSLDEPRPESSSEGNNVESH